MRWIFYYLLCCCLLSACQTNNTSQTSKNDNVSSSIEVKNRSVTVPDGVFHTASGKLLHVHRAVFTIPSSEGRQYTDEPFELVKPEPSGTITWQHAPAGAKVCGLAQPNALVTASLRLKSKPGRELSSIISSRNYIVNQTWPLIYLATNSEHVPKTIFIDYMIRQQRLCTLACDDTGIIKLLLGPLSLSSPTPPPVTIGLTAIANILAPPFSEDLSKEDVMPISSTENEIVSRIDESAVRKTLSKLHQGKSVEIAFIGDSVTCGACASHPNNSFPELFISRLKKKYPQAQITHFLVAKGGTGSSTEFAAFNKRRSKADLVVIEFINDVALDRQTLIQNYEPFVNRIKAQGSEAIICLPHLCNPTLYGLKPNDWETVERKSFYVVIPQIAKQHDIGCADVCHRSLNISREGLSPMLLLADRQMHPNDRGHALYVEELLSFFPN